MQINIIGEIGVDYTYAKFIEDYAVAIQSGEAISIAIDSPGGLISDGNKIALFIRDHQNDFSSISNSGNVASIAASIFLSLPIEKRIFDPAKGVALIHNPMAIGVEDGLTADGLKAMGGALELEQNSIKKYIAQQTNANVDVIQALMEINEPLSVAQLKSINFANIIEFKSIAYLNQTKMNEKDVKSVVDTQMGSWLDKFKSIFTTQFKSIVLTDANGEMLDFPEVSDGATVKVGDKTTAKDGSYVMPTGETYVVAGGEVTEIIPVAEEPQTPELNVELEALMQENAALKAQLKDYATLKNTVAKFKSKMIDLNPIENGQQTTKSKFTYNGKK